METWHSYGLPITERTTITTTFAFTMGASFWVAFYDCSLFDNEQLIFGSLSANNITKTSFNTNSNISNKIVIKIGSNIIYNTGITVTPNTLFHFSLGVSKDVLGVSNGSGIMINGIYYDLAFKLGFPNDSNLIAFFYTVNEFGSANCAFALFELLFVGLGANSNFNNRTLSINETLYLYNGGYGRTIKKIKQALKNSVTNYFSINDTFSFKNSNEFEHPLILNNFNHIVLGPPGVNISNIVPHIRYSNLFCSPSNILLNNSENILPLRVDNKVYLRSYILPQDNNINDFLLQNIPYINIDKKVGNITSIPTTCKTLNISNSTFTSNNQTINDFRGYEINLTSNSNLNNLTINSNSKYDINLSSTSTLNNITLNGGLIDNFNASTNGITSITFSNGAIPNGTITINNNTTYFRISGIGDRLVNLTSTSGISITTYEEGGTLTNPSAFPLDLSNCSLLTTINISSTNRIGYILLPTTPRPLSFRISSNYDLDISRIENFSTHIPTYTTINLSNSSSVVFSNSYNFSAFTSLRELTMTLSGTASFGTNTALTYLSCETTALTNISNIPVNITTLFLRGTTSLVQEINLQSHAVNNGSFFFSNSGVTNILLPTTVGRTINGFDINNSTNCYFPDVRYSHNGLFSSSSAFFRAQNIIFKYFGDIEIDSIPLGTIICSRSIIIASNDTTKCLSLQALRLSLENMITNNSGFASGVNKVLNLTHPLIVSGPDRTFELVIGSDYVQANLGNTNGTPNDGISSGTYLTATEIEKIKHLGFVLINQRNTNTNTLKYNWTLINNS